jgi:uncharacterized membrane protein YkvA (DUF1232 family)
MSSIACPGGGLGCWSPHLWVSPEFAIACAAILGRMNWWHWLLIAACATLAVYAALVAGLLLAGRRQDARALAGFIPDCIILFRRLLGDDRVPRRRKLLLGALIGYLALPFDLIPDFIPVAGQLDDAIIVALVLRSVLRSGGPQLLQEHWPGPPSSLNALTRLAYGTRQPDS